MVEAKSTCRCPDPAAGAAPTDTAKEIAGLRAYTDPAIAGYQLAKLITNLPDEMACADSPTSPLIAGAPVQADHQSAGRDVERRSNDSGAVATNRRLLGRSAHSSTSGRPLVERQLRGLLDLSDTSSLTVQRLAAA